MRLAGLLISPMFISEIAPPAFRGSLVTLSEVSLSLGILVACTRRGESTAICACVPAKPCD